MGQVNLSTKTAVAEIGKLTQEIAKLKNEIAKISAPSKASFNQVTSAIEKLGLKMSTMDGKFKTLNSLLSQNNTQFKHNTEAVKKNTTALNTLTPAMDKVAGSQKKAAETTAKLTGQYEKLSRATNEAKKRALELATKYGEGSRVAQTATARYQRLKTALDRVNQSIANTSPYDKLTAATERARQRLQNLTLTHGKNSRAVRQASREYRLLKRRLDRATVSMNGQKKGLMGLVGGFRSLAGGFGLILGAQLFGQIIMNTFQMIRTFDSLNFAMEKVASTTWELAQSNKFLQSLVMDFGVSLKSTADRWLKFRAAAIQSGLSLRDTENIFRSLTKAGAVLGLKTDELRGIYLALEQMLSKGKVTTEELRRQLGERLPGAMGIMAASMGVTISELDKMMKKGEVLSSEVLPAFARQVEISFGIESTDKVENLNASVGRLSGSWETFINNLAEGDGVIKTVLGGFLDSLTMIVQGFTFVFGTVEQKMRMMMIQQEKDRTRMIDDMIRERTEASFPDAKRADGMNLEETLKAVADARLKTSQDAFRRLSAAEAEYNAATTDAARATAQKKIDIEKEALDKADDGLALAYANQKKYYEQKRKLEIEYATNELVGMRAEVEEEQAKFDNAYDKYREDRTKSNLEDMMLYFDSLTRMKAEFNVLTKLAQQSDPIRIGGDDIDGKYTEIYLQQYKEYVSQADAIEAKRLTTHRDNLKEQLEDEKTNLEERARIALEINDTEIKIAELNRSQAVKIAKAKYDEQIESLEAYDEKTEAKLQELIDKLKKLGVKATLEERAILDSTETRLLQLKQLSHKKREDAELEFNETIQDLDLDYKNAEIQSNQTHTDKMIALYNERLEKERQAQETYYDNLIGDIKEKLIKEEATLTIEEKKVLNQKIVDLEAEKFNKLTQMQIDYWVSVRDLYKDMPFMAEYVAMLDNVIAKLRAGKKSGKPNEYTDAEKQRDEWLDLLDYAQDYADALSDILGGIYDTKLNNIETEIEREERKYARLLDMAKGNRAEQLIIERNKADALEKLEKKKRKIEREKAIAEKANALISIQISLAKGIVANMEKGTLIGIPLNAILIGLAALQTAAVLAQPLPKFEKGSPGLKKDVVGQINDGAEQEYVQRGGQILTTQQKDAIVELKRGDIIYPNFEELKRKSILVTAISNGNDLSKQDFDSLFNGIENSISKGFRKAKINNNISVMSGYNPYKEKMSNWN